MSTKKTRTPTDWNAVRLAYIHSAKSLAVIAKEFGLTADACEKRAEREEWTRLRREASESVSAAASAKIEAERAQALAEWNDADLTVAKSLRGQVAKAIRFAQAEGQPALTPVQIRALVNAAEGVQRIGRLALGATTENTGLSSPDGGPIEGANVPVEEYEHAMRRVLSDFVAPGSLGD